MGKAEFPTAAELRSKQLLTARQNILEAQEEAIRMLSTLTGVHPWGELATVRKIENALEDIKAQLDFLNEELDCAPSDREVGELAAHSINVERAGEINRG